MSKRQRVEEVAANTAAPILAGLGLEIVEVAVTGPARAPILRFVVDRPGGGVNVEMLQAASTQMETALEVVEALPGRYHLEVSSPGIDRPWKRLEDFRRHIGERAAIKTFAPLADGQRHFVGRLTFVEDEQLRFETDAGGQVVVEFSNIASARPQIDWAALLRGRRRPTEGGQGEHP